MTITYPLTIPVTFKSWRLGYETASSKSTSPFSYKEKIYNHLGDRWLLDLNFESLDKAKSFALEAFLLSLNGEVGTFLWGDPTITAPMGVGTGSPQVNGANQTGNILITDGWTINVTNILRAGDYFSIGNSLYRCLTDVNSNGSGVANIDVAPRLRTPVDNTALTLSNPKGLFRLSDGQVFWNKSIDSVTDFSISAVEAL